MSEGTNKIKKKISEVCSSLNRNTLGIIICAAIMILALVLFFVFRGTGENGKPSKQSAEEITEQVADNDLGNVTTDTNKNTQWSVMNDDEYGVEITAMEKGYNGAFVEDGSDEPVKKVYALVFTNQGDQDIQYGEYVFQSGKNELSFRFSNLPVGQSCMVLETNRKSFKKKADLTLESRVVVQVDELPFAREELLVVDNSDDTITVMNLTEKDIPVARVFYKSFDEEENRFLGGITYTAKADKIPAGSGVTLTPEHFQSGKSVVVGTGVYESD